MDREAMALRNAILRRQRMIAEYRRVIKNAELNIAVQLEEISYAGQELLTLDNARYDRK